MPKAELKYGVAKSSYSKSQENSDSQDNISIKGLAAGAHHSMILTEEGQLFTFGYGQHGQLGLKSNQNY